jgi:hypothetical protein
VGLKLGKSKSLKRKDAKQERAQRKRGKDQVTTESTEYTENEKTIKTTHKVDT